MATVHFRARFASFRTPQTVFPDHGKPRHFGAEQTFQIVASRPSSLGGLTYRLWDGGRYYQWIPASQLTVWALGQKPPKN